MGEKMHNRKGTGDDIMNNKVLFISFDSLRSDYVAGPNKKVNLPNLDKLCKDGLFFKNTIVQAPFTVPSHTSMFTGMYPFNHGVRDQVDRLNSSTPTIFDILKSKGFEVISFLDVGMLKDVGFKWDDCGDCNLKNIKSKLKEITRETSPMSFNERIEKINQVTRGWINYFKYASINQKLNELDGWLRNRLRYCIWHHWKKPNRKRKKGVQQGMAYAWSRTRMGGWAVAQSPILGTTITIQRLEKRGYVSMISMYKQVSTDYKYSLFSMI